MTTATDAARIARRYPPRRTPRWAWIVNAIAITVVMVPWLLWSAFYGATPAVSGRISAFDVKSDTLVEAVLTVQRPDPAVAATCTVVAKAISYDTVGQVPVEVPPSDRQLQDIQVRVRTLKRATTVDLESCVPVHR